MNFLIDWNTYFFPAALSSMPLITLLFSPVILLYDSVFDSDFPLLLLKVKGLLFLSSKIV